MKYFKWYTWVGIGLIFFILTIALGKMTVFVKDVTHTEAISVKVKSKQIESNIQLDTETKESEALKSVISIPYTNIDEVDQFIKDWSNKQEQDFFDEIDKKGPFFGKRKQAQFTIDTEVNMLNNDLYHLTLNMTKTIDGKENTNSLRTVAFKKEHSDGNLVHLDEVIKDSEMKKKDLITLLKEQADKDIDYDKLKKSISELNQLDWNIDEQQQEIIFYFDAGEISNDPLEVRISFLEFYPFLEDNYFNRFVSDEMHAKIDEKIAEEQRKKMEELQQRKMVAITFDDGPHPTETNRILNILDKFDAKATFFMLSKNVLEYPSIAKGIRDKGHEIANHSISHANLKAVNSDKVQREVVESAKTIEEILGVHPTLFRPPYGNYTQEVVDLAKESNQSIVLWSVDTRDWENLNPTRIYQNVMAYTHPGSIVLMHDIHATTAESLPKILKGLKKQGFEFVTVSDLMPYIEGDGVGPYYGD